jgi:iron(III) transport system substrate-binding protein
VYALILLFALATLAGAAQGQESLLLYTTTPEEYMRRLTTDFEKKHGIKVNIWRARSEVISQRVISEGRAGVNAFDVVQSFGPSVEGLRREKLLQPLKSSAATRDLIAGAVPAHGEWVATLIYVFVQAYNTARVRKEELPRSYTDLLDPKWKGMLAMESSDHEWFHAVIRGLGEEKGLRLFRDLVAHNRLSVRTGHPLLTQLVASGEVPLALTVYNYAPEQLKKKGAPIDWFAIEPAIGIPDAVAVAAHAPHAKAAALFRDYLLSEGAQRILADIGYVPTHAKVASPLRQTKLQVLDPAALVDEYERSMRLFEETVLRPGKRGQSNFPVTHPAPSNSLRKNSGA